MNSTLHLEKPEHVKVYATATVGDTYVTLPADITMQLARSENPVITEWSKDAEHTRLVASEVKDYWGDNIPEFNAALDAITDPSGEVPVKAIYNHDWLKEWEDPSVKHGIIIQWIGTDLPPMSKLDWESLPESVINSALHANVCSQLNTLYEAKNHDYGAAFSRTFAEEGTAAARIRLTDKLERFKALTKDPDAQQINSESIRDTLLDLANYAIMTIIELDKETQ